MFSRPPKGPAAYSKSAVDGSSFDAPPYGSRPRRSRKLLWIIVGVILLVVLAIGLGVGLGLGLRGGNDDNGNSGSGNGTTAPFPTPTGTVSNRVFWQPTVNSSWQIVLLNPIEVDAAATKTTPDVDVFDIDLFTNSQDTISKLQSLGKKVICYFSAGSYENFRPDSADFQSSDLGKELDGWPGEKWLRLDSQNVRKIMTRRIKLASDMGCDAIDPDNIDGYSNDNGLDLTTNDSINYMQFLSAQAAQYNMSCGLKNAGAIIPDVLNITHFSVNEQCVQFTECNTFDPFIQHNKPVFHIEYPKGSGSALDASTVNKYCADAANSTNFSTVLKNMNLNGWVEYCDDDIATTATNTSVSTSSSQ